MGVLSVDSPRVHGNPPASPTTQNIGIMGVHHHTWVLGRLHSWLVSSESQPHFWKGHFWAERAGICMLWLAHRLPQVLM